MTDVSFSQRLLAWFDEYGRKDLPWQQDINPYRVWVSEIMLQQTQVATVIPYFQRFTSRFPDVATLASADLDDVLAHWSGLGYYARGRNLHKAAVITCAQHGGELPQDVEALMALPGIGRSTAGAILSIACQQRHPILDGNVKRVLARHGRVEGWPGATAVATRLWVLAEQFTPTVRVGDYTQAIMDLGATLCTRRRPGCEACPVKEDCIAATEGLQDKLPASKPRKAIPERDTMMIMVCGNDGQVLLERRPPQGVWGGLLSFPEFQDEPACREWCERTFMPGLVRFERWPVVVHTFSHFRLRITPLRVAGGVDQSVVMDDARWVWYNHTSPSGGLAAPVKLLLDRLIGENFSTQDIFDGSYGELHQARQRS